MKETGPPVTSLADHPVWSALLSHEIGPSDTALSFSRRLARENGWSAAMAERIILEYRRFCFLAVTVDHPVTPSDAVDQAWHLHLTYTRDYWDHFCPEVLGRGLHHGPTAGGDDERHKHFDQYAHTLAAYERVFGEPPPYDIWPNAARLLCEAPKARRVHPRDVWIIEKRTVRFGLAGLLIVGLCLCYYFTGG